MGSSDRRSAPILSELGYPRLYVAVTHICHRLPSPDGLHMYPPSALIDSSGGWLEVRLGGKPFDAEDTNSGSGCGRVDELTARLGYFHGGSISSASRFVLKPRLSV